MEKKIRFAVGITLFNPDMKALYNIKRYLKLFDIVYVYDNSLTNSEYISEINRLEEIEYFFNASNDGLSVAFNKILEGCKKDSINYLLTMDQDSIFNDSEIVNMKNFILKETKLADVAIIAPKIEYNNFLEDNNSNSIIDVDYVICSGAFLNLRLIFSKNIKYDENYFIDRFDVDFCKQIRESGYRILINNRFFLKQSLGEASGYRHPNHSALRHYYSFRNRLYYNEKYYSGIEKLYRNICATLNEILLILLYENSKWMKIRAVIPAINDFHHNNMGKRK